MNPSLKRLHNKLRPRQTGFLYPVDRATSLGGLPHLSRKRDQDRTRDYKKRQITPAQRVTSPTWGPPPPCEHDLSL